MKLVEALEQTPTVRQPPVAMEQSTLWLPVNKNKVPIRSDGKPLSGWNSLASCCSYEEGRSQTQSLGVGFLLGHPLQDGRYPVCLDVDGFKKAETLPEAEAEALRQHTSSLLGRVLSLVPDAWVECSVSGKGLHFWFGVSAEDFRDFEGQGFSEGQSCIHAALVFKNKQIVITAFPYMQQGQVLGGVDLPTINGETLRALIALLTMNTGSKPKMAAAPALSIPGIPPYIAPQDRVRMNIEASWGCVPGDPFARLEKVKQALAYINADCPEPEWFAVGQALANAVLEGALPQEETRVLWHSWSATAPNRYGEAESEAKWQSCLASAGASTHPITLGTIFLKAQEGGMPVQSKDSHLPAYVQQFNKDYFVAQHGSGVFVWQIRPDQITPLRPKAFFDLYAHENFVGKENDRKKIVNAARAWFQHPARRQYKEVIFAPNSCPDGYFNLWRGFAVQPRPGDWSLLKRHILEVICSGNANHARYLLAWMALLVQEPGTPSGVAVVLRGGKGTGKGTLGNVLMKLFGRHGVHLSNSQHLVGNFNAHLHSCSFLFADEAFYAASRKEEAVLKQLITEPQILIERKGMDAEMVPNCLHILMASNSQWVVPASVDERRYFVLDVSSQRQGDHEYFKLLHHQLENGGVEAMLHDLLHYNLGSFNVREVPQTSALLEQKMASLDLVPKFLYERIQEERLHPNDSEWVCEQARERLVTAFSDFTRRCGVAGHNQQATLSEMGKWFKKIFGRHIGSKRPERQGRIWIFPNWAETKDRFEHWVRTGKAKE